MSCACAADSVLSDPAKRERYDVYGVDNSDDEYDEAEPEEEGEYLSPEDVFSMFLGIPYAQPPVGDLRWMPPSPPVAA